MTDPKNRIIDICLREIVSDQPPPDLAGSIMAAWKAECAGDQPVAAGEVQPEPPLSAQAKSRDVIINTCLDEIVGEQAPPDLKDAIIDSWIETKTKPAAERPAKPAPAKRETSRRPAWVSWATTASVILVGSLLGLVAIKLTQQSGPRDDVAGRPELAGQAGGKDKQSPQPPKQNGKSLEVQPRDIIRPPFAQRNPSGSDLEGPKPKRPYANVAPQDDRQIVESINERMQKKWQEVSVSPVALATPDEWCRRVHLKLLGRIPSARELAAFQNDTSPNRRERTVDRLLQSSEYNEQLVAHWSDYWTTVLIGRAKGPHRSGLRSYLRKALAANKPFNQIAYELISATGSTQPETADFNGAVNFLLASWDRNAVLATSRTAEVFLGQRLRCVQCHDHHSNNWRQDKFWQLNSFFRQMKSVGRGKDSRLTNVDFARGIAFFQHTDGTMGAAFPYYPDGSAAPRTGKIAEFDRRAALAKYVRDAPELSRAISNRLWSHFFGFGFTKPVTDMGPHNPPSHPELMEQLAGQLTAHQFDLRKLMKWIALSHPFALSSRIPDAENSLADSPDTGQPMFSRYYTRSLKPEEVFKSLVLLSRLRKDGFDGDIFFARQQDWVGKNTKKMDTDEGEEKNELEGIRRSIEMMNGALARQATSLNNGGVLYNVIHSKMSNDKKVEHLFLAAVARKPTKKESDFVRKMIATAGNIKSPLQDLWWALLNSNEFILDH